MALDNLPAIMDGIASTLLAANVTDRATAYPADDVQPPCAVVGYPIEAIEFDLTYQRGGDTAVIPVYFLCGLTVERAARDALGAVIAGAVSIKAALDGNLGGLVDTLRVTELHIVTLEIAAIKYLAGRFDCEVIG